MKITIVSDAAVTGQGDASVAAANLIRSMKARGHEVVVLCPDEDKAGKEGYIKVSRQEKGSAQNEAMESAIWDSDVVHIMLPGAIGRAAIKLCVRHNIPVTAGFYLLAESLTSRVRLDNPLANSLAYRYLYNSFYRYADAIQYPNELIRDVFEKAIGRKTNGFIIPDGVDERFKPNGAVKPYEFRNRFVILYAAPFSREKSHSVLIDAVAMSKHNGGIQLIFAGEGKMKSALRERSERLANKPVFAAIPHSRMVNVMNYADLYVHPAEAEIESIACMACGCVPIVADSPRSAVRRFALDERNLFGNLDPVDLAEKIDYFIDYPEAVEEYRERYQGIVAAFSREACMDSMEEMLSTVR